MAYANLSDQGTTNGDLGQHTQITDDGIPILDRRVEIFLEVILSTLS